MVFFIFSKNRSAQLDCLLSSFKNIRHIRHRAIVLYKTTDSYHLQGYEKLFLNHPQVKFVCEKQFSDQLRSLITDSDQSEIMFCTDDGIFFSPPPDLPDFDWKQVACISFRLGRNSSFCHPANETYAPPQFKKKFNYLVWKWRKAKGDFRVVYSLDAHIYPRERILDLLSKFEFQNPNQLEDRLNKFGATDAPDWMLCPPQSCYVSLPINRVNTEFTNRAGLKYPVSEEDLLAKFLSGKRLDSDRIVACSPIGPHQEFPLVWR